MMSEKTYSDAAKRMSDTVSLHLVAGQQGKWAAIRLSDGGSDNIAYDTRAEAIAHQLHETLCTYVVIQPMGMAEADAILRFTRWAYDNGHRITSPEDPDPVMPLRKEELSRLTLSRIKL